MPACFSFRRLPRKGRPGAAGVGVRAGRTDAVNVVRVKCGGPLRLSFRQAAVGDGGPVNTIRPAGSDLFMDLPQQNKCRTLCRRLTLPPGNCGPIDAARFGETLLAPAKRITDRSHIKFQFGRHGV